MSLVKIIMKAKFTNSSRFRSSSISDVSRTSSQHIKLRTIMKGRGSQQSFIDNSPNHQQPTKNISRASRINSRLSQNNNSARLSVSLNLNSLSRLDRNNVQSKSVSRNTIRQKQTQNCQQQLLGKQDFDYFYKHMINKLEDLDLAAQFLIKKKIHKIAKKTTLITLKDKGKDDVSIQIQNLIEKIRNLKLQQLQKFIVNKDNKEQVRQLMDQKIRILQKLLAENSTQSDVLKNHFFAISAINSKQKNTNRNKNSKLMQKIGNQKLAPLFSRNQRSKTQSKQQFYHQSSNKQSYNAPKRNQYQTYRYKNKDYRANLQPLPRSSYKSQYIIYNPKYVSPALKNLDNHTSFGNTRLKSSTYHKDYQQIKAQLINYKQLDGYRNKFKNIQINFNPQNRTQHSKIQFQTNRSYIVQQLKLKQLKQSVASSPSIPEIHKKFSLNTQAKSQYKGQRQQIMSNIKNKRLDKFKYNYKTLVNQ